MNPFKELESIKGIMQGEIDRLESELDEVNKENASLEGNLNELREQLENLEIEDGLIESIQNFCADCPFKDDISKCTTCYLTRWKDPVR